MKLSQRAVREFCLLTLRELDEGGLEAARVELEGVVSTAHLVRRQDNGLDLWRARGTKERQGRPRWRLLVGDGVVVSVLGESSRGQSRR